MAYSYRGIAKTQTGSVIYKRPKHRFNSVDLKRVAASVGYPADNRGELTWLKMVSEILDLLQKEIPGGIRDMSFQLMGLINLYIRSQERFRGFSGGRYGGGGASGRTDRPAWWLDTRLPE